MTHLTLSSISMPSAEIGEPNPLPPLAGDASLDKPADLSAAPDELQANAAYGRVSSIAPYLLQDNYSRQRKLVDHAVAVLENEHLRATVLLGLGGRLWSLVDLDAGRELLYRNPVFQPGNLALRNAWFAGGVEWNIGTIGHTPLTCEPLHAASVLADDGTPVLRLWEFERLRRVIYQLDFHLPEDSRVLYVHVRIVNPNAHEVPMYWWSNIAVPQREAARVLAPADRAWNYSYDNVVRHERVCAGNAGDGGDVTYPAHFADAADFFFDVSGVDQPWIAAVDADGIGMFQTSTRNLQGRKLFRWGISTGGRRWQEWLSGPIDDPAGGYVEIQAGLARTQFEHLPMPAGASWSWTEGYGAISLDGIAAHGDWASARGAAEGAVTGMVSPEELAHRHERATLLADRAPGDILHAGSGWGALERRWRARTGEPALPERGTPFPDATLGAEQQPWISLLAGDGFPDPEPGAFPPSILAYPAVVELLGECHGWAAAAVAGSTLAACGRWDEAADAWRRSLAIADNAYARRGLALVARRDGDASATTEHYLRAVDLSPHRAIVIEALAALVSAERAEAALRVIDGLDAEQRAIGRIRMLEAAAALAGGHRERAGAILRDVQLEVADLREGEDSLDVLWWTYRAQVLAAARGGAVTGNLGTGAHALGDLPAHLDFRMKPA